MKFKKNLIIIFILVFYLSFFIYPQKVFAKKRKIVKVINGQTFVDDWQYPMKLTGIKVFSEYHKYLKRIYDTWLLKKWVREKKGKKKWDSAGNQLVYIYCPSSGFKFYGRSKYYNDIYTKQGLFLNAYLVSQGYAQPDSSDGNTKYLKLFKKLYKEARQNRAGIWDYYYKKKKKKKIHPLRKPVKFDKKE